MSVAGMNNYIKIAVAKFFEIPNIIHNTIISTDITS